VGARRKNIVHGGGGSGRWLHSEVTALMSKEKKKLKERKQAIAKKLPRKAFRARKGVHPCNPRVQRLKRCGGGKKSKRKIPVGPAKTGEPGSEKREKRKGARPGHKRGN